MFKPSDPSPYSLCVCVCVDMGKHICMCAYMYVYTCMCAQVYVCIGVCVHVYVCIGVTCVYVCIGVLCMCAYIYVCICVHKCTCPCLCSRRQKVNAVCPPLLLSTLLLSQDLSQNRKCNDQLDGLANEPASQYRVSIVYQPFCRGYIVYRHTQLFCTGLHTFTANPLPTESCPQAPFLTRRHMHTGNYRWTNQ